MVLFSVKTLPVSFKKKKDWASSHSLSFSYTQETQLSEFPFPLYPSFFLSLPLHSHSTEQMYRSIITLSAAGESTMLGFAVSL